MSETNVYADQLNIETPEQVDLHFPIAGVGSRFIAILLDTLIQFVAYGLLFLIAYMSITFTSLDKFMNHHSDTAQKWFIAGFILLNFLMVWGYFALFEAFWNGQTPGKRLMKLRVIKDSGRSITLFESLARNLLRIVDMLPTMYFVGIISMLCNRENKRLGDFVAGTIVVHERVDEQPLMSHISRTFTSSVYPEPAAVQRFMPHAEQQRTATEAVLAADAVARLKPADLHVIETFFSRALDLSIAKREELGAKLAATMSAKMGVPLPQGIPPERVLELIAYRMRSEGRH